MTPPDDTPPWLRFQCHEEETGKTYYVPSKPAEKALCEAVHGSVSWKTLDKWIDLRRRLAEALGLVEPGPPIFTFNAEHVNEAVAAELRGMADSWVEHGGAEHGGMGHACELLRARADELEGK